MNIATFISANDNSFNLLHHWFQHYRQEGVTGFHLVVDDNSPDPTKLESLAPLLRAPDVTIIKTIRGYLSGDERADIINDYKTAELGTCEYVLTTDSDEFVRAPLRLAERMREDGLDYVQGIYVDRFALNGETRAIEREESIFKTFPLCANFSYEALGANFLRTPMARPSLRYISCNHLVRDFDRFKTAHWKVMVHHFKWTEGVISNIRSRLKRGFGSKLYQDECTLFLEKFADGDQRVNLKEVFTWVDSF